MDQERLRSFLQGHNCLRLPSQLIADVGWEDTEGDFADEPREGEFEEEETPCSLVVPDLF